MCPKAPEARRLGVFNSAVADSLTCGDSDNNPVPGIPHVVVEEATSSSSEKRAALPVGKVHVNMQASFARIRRFMKCTFVKLRRLLAVSGFPLLDHTYRVFVFSQRRRRVTSEADTSPAKTRICNTAKTAAQPGMLHSAGSVGASVESDMHVIKNRTFSLTIWP